MMDLPTRAAAAAAASGATPGCISGSETQVTFFDLPLEAQRAIFSHCSPDDLISLSIVCRRFHELAAERLYRYINITFHPDPGGTTTTEASSSFIDGLAGGLETLTTSNYNYAKHLRCLFMDTTEVGAKGEDSYKFCLYHTTCGKLLNNLVRLALRRARSLESFYWNIRVELSRPVFHELHSLPSLTELCLRMPAGDSYWTAPQSLPIGGDQNPTVVPNPVPPTTPFSWPHHQSPSSASIDNSHSTASQSDAEDDPSLTPSTGSLPQKEADKLEGYWSRDPPTLSGFRNLSALIILDIDNPYTIKELRTCIRRSSATLTRLRLSFSDDFVATVRMAHEDMDGEGSESIDDFHVVPGFDGTFKEFWRQEVRKFHEEALARILGVEPGLHNDKKVKKGAQDQKAPVGEGSSSERGPPKRRHRSRRGPALPEDNAVADGETTGGSADGDFDKISQTSDSDNKLREMLGPLQKLAESVMEEIERLRLQDSSQLEAQGQASERQLRLLFRQLREILDRNRLLEVGLEDAERRVEARITKASATEQPGEQYVRQTRGLSIESLAVHLIFVKASVLARALNLSCLTQLTLLDVGNQVPIWCMLIRMNNWRPLALRSLFTDHVSEEFLRLASSLEELHDLYMLQRSSSDRPQSLVPRTDTTIDQIRRTVLQAHMKTLKRLWIKEEPDRANWDVDEKTMIFICRWGTNLEELGISIGTHAVHAFLQFLPGLRSLRAIHILHFRSSDTRQWALQELRRFIVDNLSHHPHLVLDWIADDVEGGVYKVVRTPKVKMPKSPDEAATPDEKKEKIKWMGKDLDHSTALGWSLLHPLPSLPSDILGSDDEDDTEDGGKRLNISLTGPFRFDQIPEIKIFQKEVRNGRL